MGRDRDRAREAADVMLDALVLVAKLPRGEDRRGGDRRGRVREEVVAW